MLAVAVIIWTARWNQRLGLSEPHVEINVLDFLNDVQVFVNFFVQERYAGVITQERSAEVRSTITILASTSTMPALISATPASNSTTQMSTSKTPARAGVVLFFYKFFPFDCMLGNFAPLSLHMVLFDESSSSYPISATVPHDPTAPRALRQ